jgi:spoIIIJ-associated protein
MAAGTTHDPAGDTAAAAVGGSAVGKSTETVGPSSAGTEDTASADVIGGRRSRGPVDLARLEQEGEIAADYLEGLLDIADLDGDIDMDVEGERAAVSIVAGEESVGSDELRDLVGRNGEVLEALQELTRLAVLTATGERSRLMLDINGYRLARREELTRLGTQTAQRVNETREAIRLAPMSPFERKVVHDAVAALGARSESEGEEPQRRVVVLPV